MRITSDVFAGIVTGIIALSVATAYADGGCTKGWRDVTAGERAMMATVVEAAKNALPPPPDGWVLSGEDTATMPRSLCVDQESSPWVYEVSRAYYHAAVQEARNDVIAAAAADMSAQMAAKQPRLDALTAKMSALGEELGAAAQKSDFARTEALGKEMEKLSEEYKAILEEGGTTEKMNAAAAEASRDVEMRILVRVNALYEFPPPGARGLQAPGGASSAFHWTERRGDIDEGHALVLLGSWQPKGEGGFQATPPPNAAPPAAQVMSVTVIADDSRLPSTLDAIDFHALAATLSR
jgi:hypothetical protein